MRRFSVFPSIRVRDVSPVEPYKRKCIVKKPYHGTKYEDELIAHIRWLHEKENWTDASILKTFPVINKNSLRALLTYEARGKIDPKFSTKYNQ